MLQQLRRESENMCGHRGLLPNSEHQTFCFLAPLQLRWSQLKWRRKDHYSNNGTFSKFTDLYTINWNPHSEILWMRKMDLKVINKHRPLKQWENFSNKIYSKLLIQIQLSTVSWVHSLITYGIPSFHNSKVLLIYFRMFCFFRD